ncbi:MAG: NAD-dependent deacylase [Cyclobacteriaceae bacterium]|nr:NAD-dependent deacylase [Cyclobacteriaceae bacterium]
MKNLVVLTGAGISAESGIKTFRDSGGLWEGHDVMEVATPQAWHRNKELVLEFYNQRRKQERECQPNLAHQILAELETFFSVHVITQNVDSLHERAGSSQVLHLHGEINKAQSTLDPKLIYELDHWELKLGDKCEKGSQLRPHVVWFGEAVPNMIPAIKIAQKADIFLVVGTSLQVYPAADLVSYIPENTPVFLVDPNLPTHRLPQNATFINQVATEGMKILKNELLNLQ